MSNTIDNYQDVIDSRDVIARIEELQGMRTDATLSDDGICPNCGRDYKDGVTREDGSLFDQDTPYCTSDDCPKLNADDEGELSTLLKLQEQCEGYAADWKYGEALIRDSYFETYAQELADDVCGEQMRNLSWPLTCIDWEQAARELQQDYTSVDFDGVTYWIR